MRKFLDSLEIAVIKNHEHECGHFFEISANNNKGISIHKNLIDTFLEINLF